MGSLLTMDETAATQHNTTRAVFLDKAHPAAWRALNGLGLKAKEAADDAGLDQTLIELLNVRISQINGCAYCLDLHVGDAVKNGETAQRLAVLPAWRDTDLFTEKERAALTLAEAITNISDARAREHEGATARKHLTDAEFSAVSWLVIAAHERSRRERVPGLILIGPVQQAREHLVRDIAMDNQPGWRSAHLAGVEEDAPGGDVYGCFQIRGVRQDDVRGFSSEFQPYPFKVRIGRIVLERASDVR